MKGSPGDLAEREKEKGEEAERRREETKQKKDNMSISDRKIIMRHSVFKGSVSHFGKFISIDF